MSHERNEQLTAERAINWASLYATRAERLAVDGEQVSDVVDEYRDIAAYLRDWAAQQATHAACDEETRSLIRSTDQVTAELLRAAEVDQRRIAEQQATIEELRRELDAHKEAVILGTDDRISLVGALKKAEEEIDQLRRGAQ